MASSKEFVEYAAEQLREAGTITYRRMFGEYGWYCDGKFMGVICDDQLFMKITPEAERFFPDVQKAPPYEGAKDYFLLEEIDDREFLARLARVTWEALPEKKEAAGRYRKKRKIKIKIKGELKGGRKDGV